jgi:vitamin B12 transporter
MKRIYYLTVSLIFTAFFFAQAFAQTQEELNLGNVVVTATKNEVSLKETGSSVTVITSDEIEKKGKKQVIDLLQEVPGLTVSRTGVFGGPASVFIRGNNSANVLVLVDGVRINDPIDIGRGANLAFMTTDNVERIEIVKTPQSALYGSDAQAVINIITRKGEGRPVAAVSAEAGSFKTFRESLSLSGGADGVSYSIGISRQDSEGISRSENRTLGSASVIKNSDYDKDGFENTAITSKLGIDLPYNINYTLSGYYQSAEYDYDDGAESDDLNKKGEHEVVTFNNVLTQEIFPWWNHKLEYGRTSTTRRDQDNNDSLQPVNDEEHSWYKGVSNQAEWQHNFKIGEIDTITAGYNFYQEQGSSVYYYYDAWVAGDYVTSSSYLQDAATHSVYAHNHLKLYNMIYHTVGIRYDNHSEFGDRFTWNTTASVIAPVIKTRIRGAYGTSFKAPSLYQLYDSTYGSKDLDPDKGKHYEAGIEQPLLGNAVLLSAAYFHNEYDNMVDYDFVSSKYKNTGEVETKGYELYAVINLPYDINISGSYTYTEAENSVTGKELARRPKHQGSIIFNWTIMKKADLNIVYNYVGKRYDSDWDSEKMDSYSTVDLKLSYWINPNIQVYARMENAVDEDYQQVNGYAMPERSYYAGMQGHLM